MTTASDRALEKWLAEGGELHTVSPEAAAEFNAASANLAAQVIAELDAEGHRRVRVRRRTGQLTETRDQRIPFGSLSLSVRILNGVAVAGGLTLLAVMLLVSTTVFFRYVLNQPILGDQELVEMGMPLVVMAAMPFAALKGAHIRVDVLDRFIGEGGRYWGDRIRAFGVPASFSPCSSARRSPRRSMRTNTMTSPT